MVKMLVAQGWSKNEIIYEMQRIFGNDVLILNKLDDERSFVARSVPFLAMGVFGAMFLLSRRSQAILKANQTVSAASSSGKS